MRKKIILLVMLLSVVYMVAEKPKNSKNDDMKPTVIQPWVEDEVISGTGFQDAEIKVLVNGKPFHKSKKKVTVDTEKEFSVELKEKLKKGQTVEVKQVKEKKTGVTTKCVYKAEIVEPIIEGEDKIKGNLGKELVAEKIKVLVDKKEIDKERIKYKKDTGNLVIITEKLKENQKVEIKYKDKTKYKTNVAKPELYKLYEGSNEIKGKLGKNLEAEKIKVLINCKQIDGIGKINKKSGEFSVIISSTLKSGQLVQVKYGEKQVFKAFVAARVGIQEPLYEGMKVITCYLEKKAGDDKETGEDIKFSIDDKEKKKYKKNYSSSTGKLFFSLKKVLKVDQIVKIEDKNETYSYVAKVEKAPLLIKQPLYEGSRKIEGFVSLGFEEKIKKVDIEISGEENDSKKNIQVKDGKFEVTLVDPLFEGDILKAVATLDNQKISSVEVAVKSAVLDWGRIRSYFTLGSIISKNGDEFSQFDPYLEFFFNTHFSIVKKRHLGFVTYVGASFTSKAKIEKPDTSNDNGTNAINVNSGQTLSFTSEKAVMFHGGALLPIHVKTWRYRGKSNQLFLSPVMKWSIHTFFRGGQSDTEAIIPYENNLFISYSFGVRAGHFQTFHDEGVAPKLISYFDLTFGCSDDIGYIRYNPTSIEPNETFQKSINAYLEAKVKIPKTSFIIGVDAYIPLNHRKEVPGDLRIIIGTRINMDSIFSSKFIPKIQ